MLVRTAYLSQLADSIRRAPVTALLGPRQCGKTTLARAYTQDRPATFFDLESVVDQRRLQNPELALGSLEGLVILDEIQILPELFSVLRVLVDRPNNPARFLILGSASPVLIRNVSETLAGRVSFVEMSGFDLAETGFDAWETLWLRGGFPRSFLADSESDSLEWREAFIRTFLERDIPQLGFRIPVIAMRRFWTMLAHSHGQIWNASELARSLSISTRQVRTYLDLLTGTYMMRQLLPWYENLAKRQVRAPKIYFRDSGIFHSLLGISDRQSLWGHPKVGASWEGFALEGVLRVLQPTQAYFWATHNGAELDLLLFEHGKRLGFEIKFNEVPRLTNSMRVALHDLNLDALYVIYPGQHVFPLHERVIAWPLRQILELPEAKQGLQ